MDNILQALKVARVEKHCTNYDLHHSPERMGEGKHNSSVCTNGQVPGIFKELLSLDFVWAGHLEKMQASQ